jgi:aldehyde:ferredoxin oxidoreductase
MHNPLVIEAIMLIAAIIVGVWSQRALPLHADSRPILFLLCLFVGTGSALCLLLDILALLLTGQVATGGVRIYGPLLLLVVLWKPLNGLSASLKILCSGEPKKGRAKASATADDADPLSAETRITFATGPAVGRYPDRRRAMTSCHDFASPF